MPRLPEPESANLVTLTEDLLRDFKKSYCDENRIIAEILTTKMRRYLVPPILDVGAGLGDIAKRAFKDFETTLLDISPFPAAKNPLHLRVQGNFFDYTLPSGRKVGTIFLGHVLQYLDEDVPALAAKLGELDPTVIISVENDNTNEFGAMIEWSLQGVVGANPEVRVAAFPAGYAIRDQLSFSATLSCPSYEILAQHCVQVLLDAPPTRKSLLATEEKLRSILTTPSIAIEQTVYCYEKAS
jgi:hypothetical protein